ncbi:MAG: DUF6603 domain-containing protein [Polyangia bacterium]
MADTDEAYVPLSTVLSEDVWPTDYFGSIDFSFLDAVAYVGGSILDDESGLVATLDLQIMGEADFDLPAGFKFIVGRGPVNAQFFVRADGSAFDAALSADVLALRFPRNILAPVLTGTTEVDPDLTHFTEIQIPVGVAFDSEFNFDFSFDEDGPTALALPPSMIGQSGIIIAAQDVLIRLSDNQPLPPEAGPAGVPSDFRGLYIGEVDVTLPPDLSDAVPTGLKLTNCFIGSGGFSGEVTLTDTFTGSFLGSTFQLTALSIEIRQNALTGFTLQGNLSLSGFDTALGITVGLDLSGKLTIDVSQKGGLTKLVKTGVIEIDIDRIGFEVTTGGITAHAAGSVIPLYQPPSFNLKWPTLKIDDLSIDSHGHVHVSGGWLDLRNQVTLNLFGFRLDITKIGFGSTDAANWVGFSGALKLTDGISAGASVDGLKILWDDNGPVGLTMSGVGLDLVIPNALELHGKVSLDGQEFKGAVQVTIPAISMTIQGQFVAGTLPTGETTFAVFLDLELPVGIPLGPTGLGLYGFSGLFAHNREPDKHADEGWYRNPDFSDGWFTRPQEGVTDIVNKWRGATGKMGLGAGVTFGTFSDNGYTFNGRVLFVLIFPGPIVLLDGMANLFKKRASLLTSEPEFHALMVIDPGKSIEVGLDAHYKYKDAGELLDIRGSADVFFDFTDASAWHIFLGIKDPAARRIRARIFKLFDVNGFFMLDAHKLDIGAGWSLSKTWGFKHLNVSLSASMFGEAIVSWHPNHFTGAVGVSGSAGLHAFGISAGVSVSATVSGDVFQPFDLKGSFHVGLDLPWPLPDVGASVTLEWKEDFSSPPPLPVPLREASIEHPKTSNTWALTRGASLRSDDGGGQFDFERPGDQPPKTPLDVLPPFGSDVAAPRVPADTKVGLTFTRPIDDPSLIGTTNPAQVKAEIVGDPHAGKGAYTVGYALVSVDLQKWAPAPESQPAGFRWTTIQTAGPGNTGTSPDRLVGAWVPGTEDPAQGNSQQNKLVLNATTPFDYAADRSQSWVTSFVGANAGYPCPLIDPRLSARFTQDLGTVLDNPFQFDTPHFRVAWAYGGDVAANEAVVESVLGAALGPIDRGLRLETGANITPPAGSNEVILQLGNAKTLLVESGSFEFLEGDTQSNPLVFGDFTVRAYDGAGASRTLRESNTLIVIQDERVLQLSDWVEIEPAFGAVFVEVTLIVTFAFLAKVDVVAVLPDGTEGPVQSFGIGTHIVRVHQPIHVLVIRHTPGAAVQAGLQNVALRSAVRADAQVTGGPSVVFFETDGIITIQGPGLGDIHLSFTGNEFLLLEMALPSRAEAIVQSTQDALTELTKEDPLFEPENDYRVVVTTRRDDNGTSSDSNVNKVIKHANTWVDHGYFHVVGPAGVGTPDLPPQTQPGPTGFEDLRPYIEQTLPASIPPDGGKLLVPRAFYRAYDPALKFNEAYVELMYIRAKRDVTVRLFDGDSLPVLRSDGRVAILLSGWERSRQETVKDSISLWVGMVNQGPCRPDNLPPFTTASVIKDQILSSGDPILLVPERLHQVRLVPALLHEAFVGALAGLVADANGHRLERWTSQSDTGTSPRWEVQSDVVPGEVLPDGSPVKVFFAAETTGTTGSLVYVGAAGAASTADSPGNWSDFRAQVVLRWSGGVVGFEFRRRAATDLLRVTLDRSSGIRQLVSLIGGVSTVLAQDSTTFPDAGTDIELIVECVADRIRVFQDDDAVGATPIFDVSGASTAPGTVAMFASGATSSRFTEIRLDDLRPTPSVSFGFEFVSSKFTNFFHHIHSFDDRVFDEAPATALVAADLSAQVAASIAIEGTGAGSVADGLGEVADAERRAFDALEAKSFGTAALRQPETVEITRVSAAGQPLALFLRSPEPLLWDRTFLTAAGTAQAVSLPVPGDLVLTDATFGTTPASERVTLLLRSGTDLSNYRLDWRALPDATNPDPEWATYFQFGSEAPLPDGTQVIFLAVAAGQGPPLEPGTTQRLAAADPSQAVVHFTTPGVELRLAAPDGTVTGTIVHQRPFRSPDAYAPFPMRAVRRLDGTAAILFVDPNAGVALPAALRVRLTFTRAVGDEDLRMRQAGSETPEVVNLDVPLTP